jgi:GNAT superfamily N-acetyltransferase
MLAYKYRAETTIRVATAADVPRLVEMNRAAYPELVAETVVWSGSLLEEHLRRFPEGQLVAEAGRGRCISGAISTFIVPPSRDPLAQHTWLDITEHGTFASHDPAGDTLYLADVYVDPAAWGKGVGQALYVALFGLASSLGSRRVVAGGRLWGYHEYADRLSQLRAGFSVRGILVG